MNIAELFWRPLHYLVGHPERIIGLAIMFLVAFLFLRLTKNRNYWAFLVNAGLWTTFAIWEWSILVFDNDADIRADLLLIYPLLLGFAIWSVIAPIKN